MRNNRGKNVEIERLGKEIIGAAIEAHRELGPSLLESSYEHCLVHELNLRGIHTARQVIQPIPYKDLKLDEGYRIDILVDGGIILELKVVKELNEVHMAQILAYLRLSKCRLGFLLNFNVAVMKDGIRRVVNGLAESSG